MAAPDYRTCFDVKTAIEDATYSLLQQVTGSSSMYKSRDRNVVESPRFEVMYRQGSTTGRMSIIPNGSVVHSAWNGQLTITIATQRERYAVSHSVHESNVIQVFRNQSVFNSGSLLPYHEVQDLVLSGISPTIDDESNEDLSAITYEMKVGVKDTSWPS